MSSILERFQRIYEVTASRRSLGKYHYILIKKPQPKESISLAISNTATTLQYPNLIIKYLHDQCPSHSFYSSSGNYQTLELGNRRHFLSFSQHLEFPEVLYHTKKNIHSELLSKEKLHAKHSNTVQVAFLRSFHISTIFFKLFYYLGLLPQLARRIH